MIATIPMELHRSDGLPSDRWRLLCVNSLSGRADFLCGCPAAHASEYDVYCEEANLAIKLLEIKMMGFGL